VDFRVTTHFDQIGPLNKGTVYQFTFVEYLSLAITKIKNFSSHVGTRSYISRYHPT